MQLALAALLLCAPLFASCSESAQAQSTFNDENNSDGNNQVAVLLVNHGSRSAQWREALLDLQAVVEPRLLANERVGAVRTAFMEYTEPSIATQLRAFDDEGYAEIVIVPIFLTVSSHSFDDIPTILGQKDDVRARQGLAAEGIACYTPRAKVTLAPLLDFADVMHHNLKRRLESLSRQPVHEGVVLVAYGSTPYELEWQAFMQDMADDLRDSLGLQALEYAWCGHIANYSPEPTAQAIERVLETKDTALVVPVLVAIDEDFQYDMILEASQREYANGTVRYVPDAILPDPQIETWIVNIVDELTREP